MLDMLLLRGRSLEVQRVYRDDRERNDTQVESVMQGLYQKAWRERMSGKSCRIRLEDLYDLAFEKNPKAASDLKDVWETSDMSNRELVFGL